MNVLLGIFFSIIDPREIRYVDLELIQRRIELMKYCPALSTIARFNVDRATAQECKLFNRQYRNHLVQCIALYPDNQTLQNALKDTDKLYQIWDDYTDATCDYYYIHIRRQALKKLQDYSSLPPHVPFWHFIEVR